MNLVGTQQSHLASGRAVKKLTYIYFIQAGDAGPIKIGRADHPEKRLADLQIGNHEPLKLLAAFRAPAAVERGLHSRLADLHVRGEWYLPHEDVLELVERARDAAAGTIHTTWSTADGQIIYVAPERAA